MQYTIKVVWSEEFQVNCLIIFDDETGNFLSMRELCEWIEIIGGFEKNTFKM